MKQTSLTIISLERQDKQTLKWLKNKDRKFKIINIDSGIKASATEIEMIMKNDYKNDVPTNRIAWKKWINFDKYKSSRIES